MKQAGDRLGPYEIVASIGAGAMGEVYRARDVRLMRDVALKVLPETLASEPAFLGRFEREARSASAIDHPNVVTVHDVGRGDSSAWIALELVEGRTLQEVLQQGPLPPRRALAVAAQIADGLAAAHERGVVHRDLKPANVKITADGLVKILDFGLARITTAEGGVAALTASLEDGLTAPDTMIGTVAYMSPEQASGKVADYRSDQFALGDVIFEMMSGRAPFIRKTAAETLFAILREDTPPLPELGSAALPLRWILDRCLAKEPDARYASTRDLARDLHRLSEHAEHGSEPESVAAPAARPPRASARAVVRWVAASAIAGAAFAAGARAPLPPALDDLRPTRPPPAFRQITFGQGHVTAARFLQDGATVVYSAGWEGAPFSLYRKDPLAPGSVPVELPAGWLQAVSPTGATVLVVTGLQILLPGRPLGLLVEGPLSGGAPRELLEQVQFADWGPQGDLAVVHEKSGKTVLEYPQGKRLFDTPGWISYPRVSRSGDMVALIEHPSRGVERGHIVVVSREGELKLKTKLWAVTRGLAWAPGGDEVWFAASPGDELRALHAVGLDGEVRVLARAPGPLGLLDVAPNGNALVARETRHFRMSALLPDGGARELSWLDSSLLGDLSDDGLTMLFTEFGETGGLYYSTFRRSIDGSAPVKLGEGFARALSPDGAWALSIVNSVPPELRLTPARAGQPRTLNDPRLAMYHSASFLPDGARILVAANEPGKEVRLYVQDLSGSSPPRAMGRGSVATDNLQGFPASPDGQWAAVVDAEGALALRAIEREESRPLRGLPPGARPIRFTRDGKGLFVYRPDEVPARILKLDIASGTLKEWRRIAPAERAGVHIFPAVRLSADGRTCVYSYARLLTDLYLVQGLK